MYISVVVDVLDVLFIFTIVVVNVENPELRSVILILSPGTKGKNVDLNGYISPVPTPDVISLGRILFWDGL